MRRARRPKKFKPQGKRYFINEQIRAPQLRVIDEDGGHVGILDTQKALQMAKEQELDLVEISPKDNPPIAKLIDYGKFKYQEEKKKRKQQTQHKVEVKNIRLSLRIGEHDKETRINQGKKFLNEGDRLKIEMTLRGREMQHKDLAKEIISEVIKKIEQDTPIRLEQDVARQGNKFFAIVANKQ